VIAIVASLLLISQSFSTSRFSSQIVKYSSTILRSDAGGRQFSDPSNAVFVGNLPFTVTEDQFKEFLGDRIQIPFESVFVARSKETGKPRGFLFINFSSKESAEQAVSALNGCDFYGRTLNSNLKNDYQPGSTERAPRREMNDRDGAPRPPRTGGNRLPPQKTIFISNLDYGLSDEEIKNMCEDILGMGCVEQVRLPKDADTGRPRGFGYVAFVNEADVQRAIDEMNGLEVLTRPIRIEKMKPKEDSFNRG